MHTEEVHLLNIGSFECVVFGIKPVCGKFVDTSCLMNAAQLTYP